MPENNSAGVRPGGRKQSVGVATVKLKATRKKLLKMERQYIVIASFRRVWTGATAGKQIAAQTADQAFAVRSES